MKYEEYIDKSLQLAVQVQKEMQTVVQAFDDVDEFARLNLPIDINLKNRISWILIEHFRHKYIEVVTMVEEMERLVSENEPDIDKKIALLNLHAKYREKYMVLYDKTKKFMEENEERISTHKN